MKRERFLVGLIVVLYFILAVAYCRCTPYGLAPDEEAHGEYVSYLVERHKLPVLADDVTYEAHQPPLYYVLCIPFCALGKFVRLEPAEAACRLLSMFLGAFGILAAYAAARKAVADQPEVAVATAAFIAFLPMRLAISSSVNNDILTELIFSTALLLMTRTLVCGLSVRGTIVLGLVLGLGILTKTTCVILIPVTLLMVWSCKSPFSSKLAHTVSLCVIALCIGGWWLLRNDRLYGDPFAVSAFVKRFAYTATPDYWLQGRGFSLGMYVLLVAGWTFASFWGVFGQMNVFMAWWVYAVLGALTLMIIILAIREVRRAERQRLLPRSVVAVYGATVILVVLAFIGFNIRYFQAQGRYIHPALLPISLFGVLGFKALLPGRIRNLLPHAMLSGMLLFAVVALLTCLIPSLSVMR